MTNDEYGIRKAEVLQCKYGKYAEAWKDGFGDRRLVNNILCQMLGACEAIRNIEDNYSHVAIVNAIDADSKTLDEIINFFTGVSPRNGGYIADPDPML